MSSLLQKPVKNNPDFDEAVALCCSQVAGGEFSCPYIPSSNMADAFWITAWSFNHTGCRPVALHKSTGHSWVVRFADHQTKAIVDRPHWSGVRELASCRVLLDGGVA